MSIRQATIDDVPRMVDLSEKKRTQYQEFQPLFWRKAKNAREQQIPYFENQLKSNDIIILVHEDAGQIDGFIIANFRGEQECNVDDFAVTDESLWETIGKQLLQAAGEKARQRGIKNYVVVCGHLDQPKRNMLNNFGLAIDRYWYTAAINPVQSTNSDVTVREAVSLDTQRMAEIAEQPGRKYAEIDRENTIALVCEENSHILGYAIAIVIPTPPVYDPGGPTCLVLESVMKKPEGWAIAGKALLQKVQEEAIKQDAVQYVVVCAQKHQAKQNALQELGLTIASEWYIGKIQ